MTYYPLVKTSSARRFVSVKIASAILVFSAVGAARPPTSTPLASQEPPPSWAFAVNPPNAPPKPTGDAPQHVPHSSQSFTLSQIADLFAVPD